MATAPVFTPAPSMGPDVDSRRRATGHAHARVVSHAALGDLTPAASTSAQRLRTQARNRRPHALTCSCFCFFSDDGTSADASGCEGRRGCHSCGHLSRAKRCCHRCCCCSGRVILTAASEHETRCCCSHGCRSWCCHSCGRHTSPRRTHCCSVSWRSWPYSPRCWNSGTGSRRLGPVPGMKPPMRPSSSSSRAGPSAVVEYQRINERAKGRVQDANERMYEIAQAPHPLWWLSPERPKVGLPVVRLARGRKDTGVQPTCRKYTNITLHKLLGTGGSQRLRGFSNNKRTLQPSCNRLPLGQGPVLGDLLNRGDQHVGNGTVFHLVRSAFPRRLQAVD